MAEFHTIEVALPARTNDAMKSYHVEHQHFDASNIPAHKRAIFDKAFALFHDQIAVFMQDIGPATIARREVHNAKH